MSNAVLAIHESRWTHAAPFVRVGTVCIIAGGLISGVSARTPSEFGSWAVAFLVIVGTQLEKFAVIDAGGVLLAAALVLFFVGVRTPATGRGWQVNVYRALIVVVLVSVPIGLVLARLRAHGT